MSPRRAFTSTLAFTVAFTFASTAHANALDTFGYSARAESMAGAQAADVRGYAAAHHNPAGVALTDDIEAAIGYGGGVMGLTINSSDAQVTSARGTSIGLARNSIRTPSRSVSPSSSSSTTSSERVRR